MLSRGCFQGTQPSTQWQRPLLPVDPGANATIGGMIANNASGVKTVEYGALRDYVMRMTIVLPNGEVINTGSRAHKSSSGYDLTRLFIGSEGTLGVVTAATLRLSGVPEAKLAATVVFADLESASEAVAMLIGAGLEPAALELLTEDLIELMNRENGLGLQVAPLAVLRVPRDQQGQSAGDRRAGPGGLRGLRGAELCLWHRSSRTARISGGPVTKPGRPSTVPTREKPCLIVDAAIPISCYPEMVVFAREQVREQGVSGYVFGHAGDGNLHVVMAGDPADEAQWNKLETVNQLVVEKAIALGGTCTGEHGIGIGKRKFMALEHGASYQLIGAPLKDLIDPKGLIDSGKDLYLRQDRYLETDR